MTTLRDVLASGFGWRFRCLTCETTRSVPCYRLGMQAVKLGWCSRCGWFRLGMLERQPARFDAHLQTNPASARTPA